MVKIKPVYNVRPARVVDDANYTEIVFPPNNIIFDPQTSVVLAIVSQSGKNLNYYLTKKQESGHYTAAAIVRMLGGIATAASTGVLDAPFDDLLDKFNDWVTENLDERLSSSTTKYVYYNAKTGDIFWEGILTVR